MNNLLVNIKVMTFSDELQPERGKKVKLTSRTRKTHDKYTSRPKVSIKMQT